MTHILFERSGGFFGRKAKWSIEIEDLPEEEADALQELLEESDFFELPTNMVRTPAPDEFTYSITVVVEERQHSIHVSDTSMPDNLRPLLDELTSLTRRQR